jgi:ketosteroid isomerase-like protein
MLMRTKMISFVFFAVIISIFSPFLIGQLRSQTNTPRLFVSGASSPPLIAKEEEVNQFFDKYEALYNQKDINGFLSLFSSKAVQNHKDGIDKIRRIYTDFFNQSEELQYRTNRKMEIYQNALEVKGSYEIDQLNKRGERKVWSGSIHWVLTREDGVLKIISVDYQAAKSQ